jgi:Spy/CpxP family protein refolding chaperone
MKLGKRAIIIITSGVLLIGGVAACKHKMHSASAEERGEWVVEKVSEELELNDNQRVKLVAVKDEFLDMRKTIRSDRTQTRAEVLDMLKQPTLDREKMNAIVSQKIATINARSPAIVDAIGNFFDSLDDSQRAELSEFIEDKMERHAKHHSH